MRVRPGLTLVLTAALTLLANAAAAQNLVTTYVMKPKPESASVLESAVRAHSEWRERNGDPWSWDLWQVANGTNVGEFHARSDGHTWADYDAYNSSEFAARANAHFNATVGPLLAGTEAFISETDPDLSMLPDAAPRVADVTTYYLRPGQEQTFREVVRRFREAAPDQGWTSPYAVAAIRSGGQGPAMTIVALCPDWDCLGGPGMSPGEVLTAAYGEEEGMRLLERFADAYTHSESFIAVHRPDLSVPAGR